MAGAVSTSAGSELNRYPGDPVSIKALFGGAIEMAIPNRFTDVSELREVPDHQEVYGDMNRDESIIVEILEMKSDVEDANAAAWFLDDLASVQCAGSLELESKRELADEEIPGLEPGIFKALAIGKMTVAKESQGFDARNLVRVHLVIVRLRRVATDLLIVANEPLQINPYSTTARVVGAGEPVPAAQVGLMPIPEVLETVLKSFRIDDWNLFGTD
ncbi:hypothetical protein CBR_g17957 [Chara braunii]|uniref:Ran guanine nucleotide release factor n=1 Tax=Chara braunii TaxID=69332 RepID=A0A388KW22_CHABU|nr:hypothetical protein CBR_g17957 [Chara braunii]|eukprot:GBG74247.1 hypothetical protein CBR_g17957 [Chara braunii]